MIRAQKSPERTFALAAAAAGVLAAQLFASSVFAQTAEEAACRSAMAKSVTKYVSTLLNTTAKCHADRSKGKEPLSTNCNDVDQADLKDKLTKERAKVYDAIGGSKDRCSSGGAPLANVLAEFHRCPSPAAEVDDGGATTGIDSYAELADCLVALSDRLVGRISAQAIGAPATTLPSGAARCQKTLAKSIRKAMLTIGKTRAKCQKNKDKQGQGISYSCSGSDTQSGGKIFKAMAKLRAKIASACAIDDDPSKTIVQELNALGACGDTPVQLQSCVIDKIGARLGSGMVAMAYELRATCQAGGVVRTINAGAGAQQTVTELSTGWSGEAIGADVPDVTSDAVHIFCDDDCANCDVSLDTSKDTPYAFCRCAGDSKIVCDTINGADTDDCGGLLGGDSCRCYFGAPLALAAGGTPTCVLNRIRSDYSGTVDLGRQEWHDVVPLNSLVHLGIDQFSPCPTCQGDDVPNDGVRNGACSGGLTSGACDVNGDNTTFGPTSFDCLPQAATNISGNGLIINLNLSTGTTTLPSQLPCDTPPGEMCPCRVCSGNASAGCSSDTDCAAINAGTCTAGGGAGVQANRCTQGTCQSPHCCLPDGTCELGPDVTYCDGKTRANGRGYIPCQSDGDCQAVEAGNCSITEGQRCFPDPIITQGEPGVEGGVSGTIFCIAPTTSFAVNSTAGLPGPGSVVLDYEADTTCAGDSSITYEPPSGSNCPLVEPGATTTTTLLLPCGTLLPPTCAAGECPAGEMCQTDGAACSCQPGSTTTTLPPLLDCVDAPFPLCALGGNCPVGQTCQAVGAACACAPPTPPAACADTTFPVCGGTCPAGQSCQGDILGLACSCGP